MRHILAYINELLQENDINYSFMRWNGAPVYPYFTGEYTEVEPTEEDQFHEYDFKLNGFHRGSFSDLENAKTTIENLFNMHTTTINGSGVVIDYVGAFYIPIDEGELKRLQINLKIREWRVTN